MWSQNYNPTGSAFLSTLLATVPVLTRIFHRSN